MKERFVPRKFSDDSLKMIETINNILDEYRVEGFRLSLRQLYYQLVARDYIPNSQRSYKNTGALVSNARLAGLIDWGMIEDRGRETLSSPHWRSPGEIVEIAARGFRIDKWKTQPWHIEVMVEKDALSGVLGPVCQELDISITANKGYCSSSMMYEIGQRLAWHGRNRKQICIIYLGDHDPSGIDMTRDIKERLGMFSYLRSCIDVARLALNFDQVQVWRPPENPAKESDARFGTYVEQFGESSWELDAVEPKQLAELVRSHVLELRDEELWSEAIEKENGMRDKLREFADQYIDTDDENEDE